MQEDLYLIFSCLVGLVSLGSPVDTSNKSSPSAGLDKHIQFVQRCVNKNVLMIKIYCTSISFQYIFLHMMCVNVILIFN